MVMVRVRVSVIGLITSFFAFISGSQGKCPRGMTGGEEEGLNVLHWTDWPCVLHKAADVTAVRVQFLADQSFLSNCQSSISVADPSIHTSQTRCRLRLVSVGTVIHCIIRTSMPATSAALSRRHPHFDPFTRSPATLHHTDNFQLSPRSTPQDSFWCVHWRKTTWFV